MNTYTKEQVIRLMVATATAQDAALPSAERTPLEKLQQWAAARFDLFAKVSGVEGAIERLVKKDRASRLISPVTEALGSAVGQWIWDESDEGLRKIKDGIDPMQWMSQQIATGASDEEIIAAARAIGE
jgi:hypothetical protein